MIEAKVTELIRNHLGVDYVNLHDDLADDLYMSHSSIGRLLNKVERKFKITVKLNLSTPSFTVQDLCNTVDSLIKHKKTLH